jgi:amino acid transporter
VLTDADRPTEASQETVPSLHRTITWVDAFWVASGSPALILFTIGALAATVGNPAWIVWVVSIVFGFLQCFTYAEIAGLFPNKSGGASIYGAIAWVRYGKLLAPLSVWCNWIAWSPVLALGTGLAAGYILSILFLPESIVNSWSLTTLNLDWIRAGLAFRINANAILAGIIMLGIFAIQHRGILSAARVQMIFAISSLLPLILIGVVPIITGDMPLDHFTPLVPLTHGSGAGQTPGSWTAKSITVIAGGLFIAGYSTYGFETAVCYTREFRDPARDTFKAIFFSGLLCLFVFTLVPVAFQGALGLAGMLEPGIRSGMGVGKAMAYMVGATGLMANLIVVMLVMTLLLSIMTAMAGSSRTIYQGSIDGWLPRYLGKVNAHGAPVRAMWTDLIFNLILLMMSDNIFVLAASNVAYMIFIFMNLNAGWIHRIDRPNWTRPFRAPTWLLATGGVLGYVNLFIIGMGADIWGPGTLLSGLILAAVIIPVFWWRHYVVDKGVFPKPMRDDMYLAAPDDCERGRSAGLLPYIALAAGVIVIAVGHFAARF